jgi:NADPH-dependent curcumin reductase CurA
MPVIAREFHLSDRPVGLPSEKNFQLVDRRLDEPREGQLLVRNLWMSVDPYMRGRMNDRKSYIAPFKTGEPLEGSAIGIVEASAAPGYEPGELVSHFSGWRNYALVDAAGVAKIDSRVAPPQTYLGALGIPGLTAYVGLTRIARAKAGETVFVSAGSGAVGSIACQIARIKGCRVVASVGSDAKVAWLRDDLGVDAVINYRSIDNFETALAEASPGGLDIYFDNVGGVQLDAALSVANDFARFALCGMIDQYNSEHSPIGPGNIFKAVAKRLTLQGFIVVDHRDAMPEFTDQMARWLAAGNVKARETIVRGLERAPQAFLELFSGKNVGKMLVDLR